MLTISDEELKIIGSMLAAIGGLASLIFKALMASKDAQIQAANERALRAERQRDDLQLAASVAIGAGHAMMELTGGNWSPVPTRLGEESMP